METLNSTTGEVVEFACQSREVGKLAEALAKAQGELKPLTAGKTANIGSYSYKYADLADVLDCARAALSKNGLAVVQTFEVGVPIVLNTALLHTSGEWIRSSLPLTTPPTAKPQEVGSAMTYMRRYALAAMVGLAAEEDDDGATAQKAQVEKPKAATKPNVITDEQAQALYAACSKHSVTPAKAKAYLKEKLGVTSAKDIKKADFDAVMAWVEGGGDVSVQS